ncbi:hypothetical protein [Actinomycetospora chiangmaiensis]|uniref:hypothetical protein n=1 Tax=Actinomycetospora chiangmaiensis TaxID=402650 RepID=UPI0003A9E688|nr:hypothetical protein [Actinomycetospora chiangmaiensis]
MFDVNWDTRSHADIHAQLQGRGAGFTDAGGAWNSLATRLRDVAGSVERATSGIAATRTGPAAQAAGGAVGPMGPWADEIRGFSDAVGSASHEQNRALAATRGAVGPPVPRPPVTLQTWEGVGALAALDVDSAEHASADAERRARAAMGRYQEFSSLRASGLPQFSSPGQGAPRIELVSGAVPTAGGGSAAPPGVGGGPGGVGGTAPGGGVPTPGGGAAGAAAATPGSARPGAGPIGDASTASPRPGSTGAVPSLGPGSAAGGGGPTGSPRPGLPGANPGPGAGGPGGTAAGSRPGLPGAASTGTGAAPRPGGVGTAPVFGPSGGTGSVGGGLAGTVGSGLSGTVASGSSVVGGGLAGTGPSGVGNGVGAVGSGASGTGSLGSSTGVGSTGVGSTGVGGTGAGGAGAGGTPGSGSLGAGVGGTGSAGSSTAGTALTRAAAEPTRLGGASVLEPALASRGTTTNAGVPFAPMGGMGATGPVEQRLSRASYLVEDDPDALAGELPRVAPPVIGG